MKKFPTYETILLLIILVVALLSGCKVPQKSTKTVIRCDTITTAGYPMIEGDGFVEWEFGDVYNTIQTKTDTVYYNEHYPCPPTVVNARKVKNKVKDSYNYIGEINELKRSNQVKDSKIDSLVMLTGKKTVGEQTNVNNKWWVWLLVGIGVGAISYQGIRSAITKKI